MTGLTPECRPATSVTKTPSPASRQQLARSESCAGGDDEVRGRDRGQRAVALARGAAGRGAALAVGRVGVVEVGAQPAALDQRGAAARHPLAVEGGRGGPSGSRPSSCRAKASLASSSPRRPAKGERPRWTALAPRRAADQAGEAGGDGRVEDDRAGARGGLAGADHRQRPLGPLGADRLGVEAVGAAGEAEAEAGLARRPPPRPAPAGRRSSWRTRTRRRRRSRRRSRPARRSRRRRPARPPTTRGSAASAVRSTASASSATRAVLPAGDRGIAQPGQRLDLGRRAAAPRTRPRRRPRPPRRRGRRSRRRPPRRGRCRRRSRPGRRSRRGRRSPLWVAAVRLSTSPPWTRTSRPLSREA